MHTHFSAMTALNVFLAVLIMGTLWRLASYHLIASKNPAVAHAGKAMAFQY
jgi:hypothetical protein